MGAHAHRNAAEPPARPPARPPRARSDAPLYSMPIREPAAVLAVLESVHSERLAALRTLQAVMSRDRRFACAIVAHNGYPALSLARMDGRGSMRLGCEYSGERGEWWHVRIRPDGTSAWLAPTREPAKTAYLAVEILLGGAQP